MNFLVIYDVIRNSKSVGNAMVTTTEKLVVSLDNSVLVFDTELIGRAWLIEGSNALRPLWSDGPEFIRGVQDCYQDGCENAWPLSTLPERQDDLTPCAPKYAEHPDDYMRGYAAQSKFEVGENWLIFAKDRFAEERAARKK